MRSSIRRGLATLGHEALLPLLLLLLTPALAGLLGEASSRHEGESSAEHARSCPVCRSPYRFARSSFETEAPVDLGLNFSYE